MSNDDASKVYDVTHRTFSHVLADDLHLLRGSEIVGGAIGHLCLMTIRRVSHLPTSGVGRRHRKTARREFQTTTKLPVHA